MRFSALALLALPTAVMLFSSGCVIGDCKNTEPGTKCYSLEPATRYEAPKQTMSAAWTAGKPVRVVSANGKVKVVSASGSDVEATFAPFTLGAKDENDQAAAEMRDDLVLSVVDAGTEVLVSVKRKSGSNGGLGADLTVRLPSGFDGGFELTQGNGSVDVDLSKVTPLSTKVHNNGAGSLTIAGARGALDIEADVGDIDLRVAGLGTADGAVFTGNGDISLFLPAEADGKLVLSADGTVTESGVPSSWISDGAGSYTMNAGAGGTLSVTTDFGDISLAVE